MEMVCYGKNDTFDLNTNLSISFNSVSDYIFILNHRGDILSANNIVLDQFQYTANELCKKSIFDLHAQNHPIHHQCDFNTFVLKSSDYCDCPLLSKQGQLIPVETIFINGQWNDKHVIIALSRDIRERLLLEKERRDQERDQLLNIEEKMSSLGRVSAGIAHEIRNPLSTINVYISTLKRLFLEKDNLPYDNQQYFRDIIEEINSASQQIENVIKRVMDFAKPNPPKCKVVNINDCITDGISLTQGILHKTNINLKVDLDPNLPPCMAEAQSISQVLINLISNAAEAMKSIHSDKQLLIKTYTSQQLIVITVSDNGPGVPYSEREKIFDPFYTTKKSGSGIGLSISVRIIKDHKGTIEFKPSSSGGAEFTIYLPIYES